MKIFITGGTGFIGTYLISTLESSAHEYCLYDGDILDKKKLEKDLNSFKPDFIFHLAAFNDNTKSFESPENCISINVTGTLNLLELTKNNKIRILIPSTYYLGTQDISSPYILSKLMQEELALSYNKFFNTDAIVIRLANVYGHNKFHDTVLQSIAAKIIDDQVEIEVGDLSIKRDFIYIKDIIAAFHKVLEANIDNSKVYELGTGQVASIKHATDLMLKILNKKPLFKQNLNSFKGNSNPSIQAKPQDFLKSIKWQPSFSIESGIEDMLQMMMRS